MGFMRPNCTPFSTFHANDKILALDRDQLTQALLERLEVPRDSSRRTHMQASDLVDLPRRLCHGGERRYEQTEGKLTRHPTELNHMVVSSHRPPADLLLAL
jgi:hypothetical protein